MATEKEIFISINGTQQAIKSLDDLNKATQQLADGFEEAGDAADDAAKKTEEAGKETGFLQDRYEGLKGTVSKLKADFKLATKGIRTFFTTGTKGAKALKIAFASTGIGLLVVAIVSLIDYFKDTEEGSRFLQVAFESVGVILNLLIDSIADFGSTIIDVFTNPVESIKNFADTIKAFVTDKIEQLIEGLGLLGQAIGAVFEGDFSKAADLASEGFTKVGDSVLALNPVTAVAYQLGQTIINDVVPAVKAAVVATNDLVVSQRALRDLQQELIVENAELTKSLEVNQKVAEDTTLAYDERAAALEKVNEANIALAKNQADLAAAEETAIKNELALADSYEDREELETRLAEATASRIETETALELKKQEAAKLSRELELEEVERQRGVNAVLEGLRLENIQNEEEAALEGLRLAEEATIRELELARADEEQILEAQRLFEEQRTQLAKEFADQRDAAAKESADKQTEIEKKRKADIISAEEELQAAVFNAARGGLAALSQIAGDNEKLQNTLFLVDQAVAAAQVIVNSVKEKAANAAYAATLGPAGPAYLIPKNTATNIRTGVALASIAATSIAKLRGGKGQTPSDTGGGGGIDAPQFDPTQAIDAQNQGLTDLQDPGAAVTPGGGNAAPVRAYVVATEVTNAQEANAQIENLATL